MEQFVIDWRAINDFMIYTGMPILSYIAGVLLGIKGLWLIWVGVKEKRTYENGLSAQYVGRHYIAVAIGLVMLPILLSKASVASGVYQKDVSYQVLNLNNKPTK